MHTYTFRPYFAYDCDSQMGFNNGHYLDEVTVTARDEGDARGKVMELLAETFDFTTIDRDETEALDVDAAWTFDHVWRTESGEEFQTEPADVEAECFYLYKYLDLGEPEVL
jgi:hypothetical protein